jgi:CBS domain-containing protein
MSIRCVQTVADQVPVTEVMSRVLVTTRKELPAADVAKQMLRSHIGCVPVVDERGHPRGIVTKTDLLELITKPRMLESATVGDVMMPLAIVLDERATIAHCAQMMAIEDFHHVMIVASGGALIGVVSSQDVVRWLVANDTATSAA